MKLVKTLLLAAFASMISVGTANAFTCTPTLTISGTPYCIFQDASGNYFAAMGVLGWGGIQADVDSSHNLYVNGSRVTQPVSQVTAPTGGATTNSTCSAVAPASLGAAQLCKTGAGTVYDIQIGSNLATGSGAFLKLYDAATPPTCGSGAGTPVGRYPIPANATANNLAGNDIVFPMGKAFVNGIYWCVTGGLTDSDATAIGANTVTVNVDFK
jgi:hypothetical protein